MHPAEILLLLAMLAFPLYDRLLSRVDKLHGYYWTLLVLWLPTASLLVLHESARLSVADLGLQPVMEWPFFVGLLALAAFVAYIIYAVRSVALNAGTAQEVAQKLAPHRDLLPTTRAQAIVFCLPVSISAGVCEDCCSAAICCPCCVSTSG